MTDENGLMVFGVVVVIGIVSIWLRRSQKSADDRATFWRKFFLRSTDFSGAVELELISARFSCQAALCARSVLVSSLLRAQKDIAEVDDGKCPDEDFENFLSPRLQRILSADASYLRANREVQICAKNIEKRISEACQLLSDIELYSKDKSAAVKKEARTLREELVNEIFSARGEIRKLVERAGREGFGLLNVNDSTKGRLLQLRWQEARDDLRQRLSEQEALINANEPATKKG